MVVLFTVLVFFGVYTYRSLNQELFPEFQADVITIGTVYPGFGGRKFRNEGNRKCAVFARRLGQNHFRFDGKLFNGNGAAEKRLERQFIPAQHTAQNQCHSRQFAGRSEESSLSDFRISDLPVMTIGATAKMEETVFFDLMDREIKPMPERIPGVGNVNLTGGQEREIQINLNSERMSAYNLSILEVSQTLLISNWKN